MALVSGIAKMFFDNLSRFAGVTGALAEAGIRG